MKKKTFLLFFLVCGVCVFCFSDTPDERIANLEKKVKDLEQRILKLEETISQMKAVASPQGKPLTTKQEEGKCLLVLSEWDYSFQKGDFSNYYKIRYKLTNNYEKAIKLLDASIHFEDLLGEHIYGIKIDPDLLIPSKGFKEDSGTYGINEFMNEQMRMKNMKKKDIVTKLKVRKLVFEDNTILEF